MGCLRLLALLFECDLLQEKRSLRGSGTLRPKSTEAAGGAAVSVTDEPAVRTGRHGQYGVTDRIADGRTGGGKHHPEGVQN